MNEVPLPGFEDRYTISPDGTVRSIQSWSKGKTKRQFVLNSSGYRIVGLWDGVKVYSKLVHRLVAIAFLPKVPGKSYVNHKDRNKLNNHVDNLEWVSMNENAAHYHATTLRDAEVERIILKRVPALRRGFKCLCVCPGCRVRFWVYESNIKAGQKTFCTRRCGADYKKKHLVLN